MFKTMDQRIIGNPYEVHLGIIHINPPIAATRQSGATFPKPYGFLIDTSNLVMFKTYVNNINMMISYQRKPKKTTIFGIAV